MADLEQYKARIKAFILGRQTAYRRTFGGAPGAVVLNDLAKFCRAYDSVYHDNQRLTDIAIGRNEVWLRIQNHLKLSPDELFALSTTGQPGARVQTEEFDNDDRIER